MLERIALDKLLFLDIETVPQNYVFDQLDEKTRELFEAKTRFMKKERKLVGRMDLEQYSV